MTLPANVTSTNGTAMAAVMAAGIGAFAVGFVVILNELGLTIPALYAPAGGVSGRTTLSVVIWLVAWAVLHNRWRTRDVEPGRVFLITLLLTLVGTILTMPPVWGLV